MSESLKVLAVGDPAVYAYVDSRHRFLSRYEERNAVRVQFDIIPWESYCDRLFAVFRGDEEYDIVMIAGHLWLKNYAASGFLAPVFYPADEEWDGGDILPAVRQEMDCDGTTYLYPSFCDGHMVLYRKSAVLERTGSLPGTAVSTEDVIRMARQCDGWHGMRGIALKAHPSEIFLDALPYFYREGTEIFDPITHRPAFNNERGAAALNKYIGLKNFAPDDAYRSGNDEVRLAFQQRRVAAAVTWGGQLGLVLNEECLELEDVGVAALQTAWNVTWSFGISARSAKQAEANALLRYLSAKEADRIIGAHAGSPVRQSTYERDGDEHSWYGAHLRMLEQHARPLPSLVQAGEVMGVLYQEIFEAFQGLRSAEAALQRAEARINAVQEGGG